MDLGQLLQDNLNAIAAGVGAFVGNWAVFRYRLSGVEEKVDKVETKVENVSNKINDEIKMANQAHELIKQEAEARVNALESKVDGHYDGFVKAIERVRAVETKVDFIIDLLQKDK